MKEILYGNGTKAQYTYDSAGRLARLRNRAAGGADMSHHAYSYDANGNITRIDLGAEGTARDAWTYVYDALNRLTRETRLAVTAADEETTRWYRDYAYDPAGNRTAMTWFDGSTGYSSSYAYNALNQLLWSNQYNPNELFTYAFDSRGNMTQKWEDLATNDWQYDWNADNRLTKVTMTHQATQTQKTDVEYAYDHQGARVLKRRLLADGAADGARTRYFFHGLTEEVVKCSVAGAKSIFNRMDKMDKMKAIKSCESCKSCQNIYFLTGRRRARVGAQALGGGGKKHF